MALAADWIEQMYSNKRKWKRNQAAAKTSEKHTISMKYYIAWAIHMHATHWRSSFFIFIAFKCAAVSFTLSLFKFFSAFGTFLFSLPCIVFLCSFCFALDRGSFSCVFTRYWRYGYKIIERLKYENFRSIGIHLHREKGSFIPNMSLFDAIWLRTLLTWAFLFRPFQCHNDILDKHSWQSPMRNIHL